MKILIVDDEYSKVQEISNVLALTGVVDLYIEQATTAQAARCLLQAADYDMLIIDLNLPAVMGGKPDDEGGISLFDMINLDEKVKLPADVLFITGKEELLNAANIKVIERGAVLCQYRADSDEWKRILLGRVKYAAKRIKRKNKIDMVIVTALRSPELDAVLDLPYEWKPERIEGDPLTYHFGNISKPDGNITVVSASPNKKGMPSSAAVASKLLIFP